MFERWSSVRALWAAAHRAARGKRRRASVARTLLELEGTVLRLSDQLRSGEWRPGPPRKLVVQDGKRRLISVAPFEDRIVHQALCAEIGPLLDRGLIEHTYACRLGRGTHAALRRAVDWARCRRYFVRLDAQKYFPSIDHEILRAQLGRDVSCPQTLAVCDAILGAVDPAKAARFHFPGDDLFTPFGRAVGLPIGSLTSQHFANRYLSPVDHKAKDRLRIRAYLRYMDDMLLFDDDRARLVDHAHALEELCQRHRLRLHRWEVMPTAAGVGFLGFRILPEQLRVKATSVNRAIARFTRLRLAAERDPGLWPEVTASIRSTFAHWDHGDTWRLKAKALDKAGLLTPFEAPAWELRRERG